MQFLWREGIPKCKARFIRNDEIVWLKVQSQKENSSASLASAWVAFRVQLALSVSLQVLMFQPHHVDIYFIPNALKDGFKPTIQRIAHIVELMSNLTKSRRFIFLPLNLAMKKRKMTVLRNCWRLFLTLPVQEQTVLVKLSKCWWKMFAFNVRGQRKNPKNVGLYKKFIIANANHILW